VAAWAKRKREYGVKPNMAAAAERATMTNRTNTDQHREALGLLIRGLQVSRMIRPVADFGIADKVAVDTGCDVHELASACTVKPHPLLACCGLWRPLKSFVRRRWPWWALAALVAVANRCAEAHVRRGAASGPRPAHGTPGALSTWH
jgi:hypothetical protein